KVSTYDPIALQEAVRQICQPEEQLVLRATAAAHSPLFGATGLADWIWQSLEHGEPSDDRFENAFRRRESEVVEYAEYLDPPAPRDLKADHGSLIYHAFRRLKNRGYRPDFVIDVGASTGVWSDTSKHVFPNARYLLVEPLHAQYAQHNKWFFRRHPDFENIAA